MSREGGLKFVMIAAGLLFSAGIYPLVASLWAWQHSDEIVPMFLSLYVSLGVFLLIAARNPAEHRSLIAFAAWSSIAHAAVMLVQSYADVAGRPELYGMSALLIAIGVPLLALAPARRPATLAAAPAN
jgi:succinate-acetate transporter protein